MPRTPAERALARSFTLGGTRFDVCALTVDRGLTLTCHLTVADEPWEVTLPWPDTSFTDVLTSPAPDPDRLAMLVHLVRSELDEWWSTKARSPYYRRLGRRLP